MHFQKLLTLLMMPGSVMKGSEWVAESPWFKSCKLLTHTCTHEKWPMIWLYISSSRFIYQNWYRYWLMIHSIVIDNIIYIISAILEISTISNKSHSEYLKIRYAICSIYRCWSIFKTLIKTHTVKYLYSKYQCASKTDIWC